MRRLLLPLLLSSLAGCAAPSAGAASSPVTVNLSGARFGCGTTLTVSVTITPTSEATQKADAKVDAKATVPVR